MLGVNGSIEQETILYNMATSVMKLTDEYEDFIIAKYLIN